MIASNNNQFEKVKYNTRIKLYKDHFSITCFNCRIFNPECIESTQTRRKSYSKSSDNIQRLDNKNRAKAKIKDIAFANEWDYFVTLTLDRTKIDRYDVQEISKSLKIWLNNNSIRKAIKYLIIPELHEDGAIHFHGLITGGTLKFTDSGHMTKRGQIIYNLENWPFGYTTAVKLITPERCCNYILKYITKQTKSIFGNAYFAGGKGLIREVETQFENIDYASFDGKEYEIQNGIYYVKYKTVYIDNNSGGNYYNAFKNNNGRE